MGVIFSVVDSGLFCTPGMFSPAAPTAGASEDSTAAAAAAPAAVIPIPARNLRRFQYKPLGVISREGMSSACLISIEEPPSYIYAILNILDLGDVGGEEKLQAKLPGGRSRRQNPA